MKAIILNKTGEISQLKHNLQIEETGIPEISKDEVLVKLHFSALNHRDLWITKGLYSGIKLPVILGSDGAGTIEKTGDEVRRIKINDEVIINPAFNWGENEDFQSRNFQILGLPENGTLSEYIKVKEKYIHIKPSHLNMQEAAALPLAGLTAYRAVFRKAEITENDNVLITGIGGGVSTFALLFVKALGAKVYVTSGSDDKIKFAKQTGAEDGFNYKNEMWDEVLLSAVNGGIDAVIDGTGGNTINKLIKIINPGGRIVNYGATTGNTHNFDVRKLFWKQLKFMGTTMGSENDFREMLNFIEQKKIKPLTDKIFEFGDYISAFERMNRSEQIGKIVIKI